MFLEKPSKEKPAICWWSGGVTSAVACWLAIHWFGVENVRVVFIDTRSEDEDTYRFKNDCEVWYGVRIETISNPDYEDVEDVWYRHLSLNIAVGAKCSQVMKRAVREQFEKRNRFICQVFGFDINEAKRARAMALNSPQISPVFPLLMLGIDKKDCLSMLPNDLFLRIDPPRTYLLGFLNNNCFKKGCVQGGIGYWQKMMIDFPAKFDHMAKVEHDLTDKKGEPVTMLKDQSKGGGLVFLKPHPNYPGVKDISMMKGRQPKPLFECNGFCGTNDLSDREETEKEINYQ